MYSFIQVIWQHFPLLWKSKCNNDIFFLLLSKIKLSICALDIKKSEGVEKTAAVAQSMEYISEFEQHTGLKILD